MFSTREIRIVTANDDFAERLPRLFRRAFSLDFDERPAEGARGKRRFLISDAGKIAAVYRAFGMEAAETLTLHINLGALENECCRASFVRGAFLAGGSVTDPAKSYHLELATTHASVSRELCSVLLELGFEPGQAMRGANYVTYMKQSEAIADFLTAVGAPRGGAGRHVGEGRAGHAQRDKPQGELRHGERGQDRRRRARSSLAGPYEPWSRSTAWTACRRACSRPRC